MYQRSWNITAKICIFILVVETILLCAMGVYYIFRYWEEIDTSVAEKMSLPARLMSQGALTFDSVTDFYVLEDLINEEVEDAFIAKRNGKVFYSIYPERVGHYFGNFLDREEKSGLPRSPQSNHFIFYTDSEGNNYRSVLSPIVVNNQILGDLYIKIRSDSIQQRKKNMMYLFMAGVLLTILFTTLLEAYFVRKIIVPRLKITLSVLEKVENRDFSARIPDKGPRDELGALIEQVNSMIGEIDGNVKWLRLLSLASELLSHAADKKEFMNAVIEIFSQYLSISFSEEQRGEILEKLNTLSFDPEEENRVAAIFEKYGLDMSNSSVREFYPELYGKITTVMERQKSLSALKDAEENYRNLFSSAVEGIYRVACSGKPLVVNPSLASMMGYESPEVMLNTCTNVVEHYENPDDRNRFLEQIEQDGHVNDFDVRLTRKNGSSFYASITSHAIKDEQGNIIELEGRILDITERKKREQAELDREKAVAAEKAAELASRAKSEFCANMSHELRTPLNAILGFAQIMERNPEISSERESLEIIKRSGNHLLTLINQVLDLTKIEAGRASLEENCFDLFRLLGELENMLSLKAADKDLTLTFDRGEEVPHYICTDEIKLRQVLINLLNNAIKFTRKGSVALRTSLMGSNTTGVSLKNKKLQSPSCQESECLLHFEITDTGIGIAPEEIELLFEAFGQTPGGKMLSEGTGLGLVISNKFVELLGGEMHVVSKVGQGSVFSFNIPVQVVSEKEITSKLPSTSVVGLKPGQPCYRILVVDDKRDNRKLIVRMLNPFGFELREAENGQEVLDILDTWEPHLIWMDMRMPVMDGYEATRRIRALATCVKQPVIIAVTASALNENQEVVFKCGCEDIILKPFQENDIFGMLRKHLNVRFAYAGGELPLETTNTNTEKLKLSPSDFHSLPKEMVSKFLESVETLEMDTALDVITEIREQNESLADALQKLVSDYRFDTLQELLNQSE